ncbi:MAG: hypothetical protein KKE16_01525 [Firmicutes bacterium]|nr:hypothetical protein [Bacillota bacterium]
MLITQINIDPNPDNGFPFFLPIFQKPIHVTIHKPVLILVGDNGTGKSSLMKTVQQKLGLYEIEMNDFIKKDKIDVTSVNVSYHLSKPKGFFFESSKFITYLEYINKEKTLAEEELKRVEKEYRNSSDFAQQMASTPFKRTIGELNGMYKHDLSKSSHGESYLDFFTSRLRPGQLYLLDEPETPLSVQNQLTLLALILDGVKQDCQFIIATHSPILSAIPHAQIIEIKNQQLIEIKYEEIESIQLLKQFINHKDQFLKHFE